jgi:hypothetical protein
MYRGMPLIDDIRASISCLMFALNPQLECLVVCAVHVCVA